MAKYTLRSFYNTKLVERFEHRSKIKLHSILTHPKNNQAGKTDPWGNEEEHPNRFEIYDSQMDRIFQGNVEDTLNFIKNL